MVVTLVSLVIFNRHGGNSRKRCDPVLRNKRSSVCHVSTERSALLSDPANGQSGPERRVVEVTRFCSLGSQTGLQSYLYC